MKGSSPETQLAGFLAKYTTAFSFTEQQAFLVAMKSTTDRFLG